MSEDIIHTGASAYGLDSDRAEHWSNKALCTQVDVGELFFPNKGESTKPAKRICMACEVRTECLEDALAENERYGIRGGLSERERRKLPRGSGRRFCRLCGVRISKGRNSDLCATHARRAA